jgi:hypothetical protein
VNLGERGPGCVECGRAVHDGACLPPAPPIPDRWSDTGSSEPRLSTAEKVGLAALGVIAFCIVVGLLVHFDVKERDQWRADWMRRTELCEAQGGIPRYQVRGRSYDGCDFPARQQ